MLLKVCLGRGEWQYVNGDSHCVHLRHLLQSKCQAWPEGVSSGLLDLCDLETGALMGLHMLEPWDMATSCFVQLDINRKFFTPVALTVEKGTLKSILPMLDNFAEQFPHCQAALDSMLHTKIKEESSRTKRRITNRTVAQVSSQKDTKAKPKGTKKSKDKKGGKK